MRFYWQLLTYIYLMHLIMHKNLQLREKQDYTMLILQSVMTAVIQYKHWDHY